MGIIGGTIGGILAMIGGLLNSVGMSLGLTAQQLLVMVGDTANNMAAIAGGAGQNLIVGLTNGQSPQEIMSQAAQGVSGLIPTGIDAGTLGL
jgi:hypothetical protein